MDPKEYKLTRPVEFGGQMIDTLYAKHVVTVDDIEDGYDEVEMIRASKKKPSLAEKDLTQIEMVKIAVARATGHPVEVMGLLSIKDLLAVNGEFEDFLL